VPKLRKINKRAGVTSKLSTDRHSTYGNNQIFQLCIVRNKQPTTETFQKDSTVTRKETIEKINDKITSGAKKYYL
jgi:hypothetical protein